jgi:hypothetical protein
MIGMPITVAARSKAWTVFARSIAGIMGSNPTQRHECLCTFSLCLYCFVCRQRPSDGLITRPRSANVCVRKDDETEEEARAQQRAVVPLMKELMDLWEWKVTSTLEWNKDSYKMRPVYVVLWVLCATKPVAIPRPNFTQCSHLRRRDTFCISIRRARLYSTALSPDLSSQRTFRVRCYILSLLWIMWIRLP